jgi:L-fuculose-phosphate aldolase
MDHRSLLHPRDEILTLIDRIYRHRMTTTSGGNLSIRDGEDVWITPARVDKGTLRRTDIVCIRGDGTAEGQHRPSSELPFHQAIYAARPDLRAIVHAHPVALVAFSMIREVPNTRLFPQARFMCGEVGFAPYALPGSDSLARNIADTFARGHDCVVLENHGVVVGAPTLSLAFQRFEALEFAAKTIIKARLLGPVRYLTDDQLQIAQRRRLELEVAAPELASSRERELRRQLCEFVRRGCQQRLLISTEGSFSARLTEDAFLITPSQHDRYTLDLEEIVRVRGNTCERGRYPSRATPVHQAIYRQHPEIQAIVFAHPVNATAFSVTGFKIDARTIPESYIFLREVGQLPFGLQYQDGASLAELVSFRQPAALLDHDGVLVLGSSVLDAFDRLEVLEATAEALINARQLGEIAPMSAEVIRNLKTAFGI